MGLFDFLKGQDINAGVDRYKATPKAVLLDVRTREEYAERHIPDSCNLPLSEIGQAATVISDRSTPVFVYCRSGNRSNQAMIKLRNMGYQNVENIGGIDSYRGKVER